MPPKGHRKKLKVAKAERPPDVSEALWQAVPEIARIANDQGWGQAEVGERAGVVAAQVSKWLSRKNTPELLSVTRFEEAVGLERGSLTRLPGELGRKLTPQAILDAATALGLDETILDVLAGGASEVAELPEGLKRAVLGVVHLLGYSLEVASRAARQAQKENPSLKDDAMPTIWLEYMRPILSKYGPPGSGSFPRSDKFKLG